MTFGTITSYHLGSFSTELCSNEYLSQYDDIDKIGLNNDNVLRIEISITICSYKQDCTVNIDLINASTNKADIKSGLASTLSSIFAPSLSLQIVNTRPSFFL